MPTRFIPIVLIIFLISLAACGGTAENPVEEAPAPPTAAVVAEEPVEASTPTEVAPPATPTPEPAEATVPVEPTETSAAPAEPSPTAAESGSESVAEATQRSFRLAPEASSASYAVEEEFFNRPINFVTAVGTTQEIEGEFTLDVADNQVSLGENRFVVDLRTLTSDSSRRDSRIRQQWLESDSYPFAEFVATGLEDFPAEVAEGEDVTFKIVGDMTIREVTRPVTFDTTARLEGDTFTGAATSHLLMRDFGFEPPSILGMLEVTDGVTVTVEFTATEANNPS